MTDDAPEYACTNEQCLRYLQVWQVWSEAGEILCTACGWFMSAVYD